MPMFFCWKNDALVIGPNREVRVVVEDVCGDKVSLGAETPKDWPILRESHEQRIAVRNAEEALQKITLRLPLLTLEQLKAVCALAERVGQEGKVGATRVSPAPSGITQELPKHYGKPGQSGPGPWCEECGNTMGLHGGDLFCTSCHPYP